MEHSHRSCFVVRLFGHPELELDGAPLRLERQKTVALLAYLAVGGAPVARDTLAALFWPDCDGAQAGAYLRRTLWELRRALGPERLEADRETVSLLLGPGLWVDVARFRQLAAGLREGARQLAPLEEAAALYRGDFLAGFSLRDSPDFDDWQSLQAEALRHELGLVLAALAQAHGERGDWGAAIDAARRWLALDPLDEASHRALMQLYAWSGQRGAAIRQYEACIAILDEELGAAPEAETAALGQEIRAGRVGRRRVPASVARAPLTPRLGPALPADHTPFVGREAELTEIGRLLADRECRLLTLIGPGGVGKTRLAIQAARAAGAAFAAGVAFVPLAAQSSAEGLLAALVEGVQPWQHASGPARSHQAGPRGQLLASLRDQALLLILDSAEHLAADVADLLSELLPAGPQLKLLVTSRERLRLPEEWVFEVAGLPYPEAGAAGDPAACPAAQLFLKAAGRARIGYSPGPDDWPAVARICRSVEGLPLAIELAAPWVRLLSCAEIAAEIEGNRDFLASQAGGLPERHRSLRAAFEHSWRLLPAAEREVLARLSVFAGGLTREAAAEVAGAQVADLSALLDRSLLRRDRAGRLDLHQTLKQYAAEKLALSPEAERQVRSRHSAHYLDWLAATGEGLRGREQRQALGLLLGEVGNLRLAWQQALAAGEWGRVRRALPAWALFAEMGPRRREGYEAICSAVEAAGAAVRREGSDTTLNALLALALAARRFLGMSLEPGLPLEPLRQESLALAQDLPDCAEKALTFLLSAVGPGPHSAAECQALAKESEALFEGLGDRWGVAMARLVWADGAIYGARDDAAALPAYLEARSRFRALGNRWGEALCLFGLTTLALQEARYDEALRLGQECVGVYQELGNPARIVDALALTAVAAREAGNLGALRGCLAEALAPLEETGQRARLARALADLCEVAAAQGDGPAAESYRQRALALYHELGDGEGLQNPLPALDQLQAGNAAQGHNDRGQGQGRSRR